eukprot:Phypoly_transcript_23913.p1 GENE.Phypoly_transcript_23913~~Phypoly_transcript_23913.p1  ORF type:complete len:122 (+),score=9.58 Phypoly_transcript_23913:33-368(+)
MGEGELISLYFKTSLSDPEWRLVDVPTNITRGQAARQLLELTGFQHGFVGFYNADANTATGVVIRPHVLKSREDSLPLPVADLADGAPLKYRALVEPGNINQLDLKLHCTN